MSECRFEPLTTYRALPPDEMRRRAAGFLVEMKRRRTVRTFSDQPVDHAVVKDCLRVAAPAPSGANQQPWQFVVVSDPAVKRQIRRAAEEVETDFYRAEATHQWTADLAHLGTVADKPFLETAPCLIVIFSQLFSYRENGEKQKHYYVKESVGIATGMLITALHHAGLASLTYTPARMRFLNRILGRPSREKPFMILVVGYPQKDTVVPVIRKKSLKEMATFV